MKVVAKIGSSSLTTTSGDIDHAAVAKICAEVADLRQDGHHVIVVTSAAISAPTGCHRPKIIAASPMKPRPPVIPSSKRPTEPSVNQAPPKPATMPASVTLM